MLKPTSEWISPASAPHSPAHRRARLWYGLVACAVIIIVCVLLADAGVSFLMRHTMLNRRLTVRLEAAFGRPVQVGTYAFSLWTGPEIIAYPVRVGEDPRFGYEYFLRADSIALRVRLSSLLRGHLELGTISLSHPSLNLVRDADGDWNVAEWLPRPQSAGTVVAKRNTAAAAKVPRVYKIEVDGGRINFKRGDEKLPFALVDVNGTAETEGPGRWQLDLVAAPERAAVTVQDPGVLHLVGRLGGTSSRLRPAALQIDWSDASLPDVLRLTSQSDFGVRGTLGISLFARTEGDTWVLSGNALLSQLHRWNLPLRSDNPAVRIVASGRLDPSGSRIELTSGKIEMDHSSAAITGALDWTNPGPEFAGLFITPPAASKIRPRHPLGETNSGTELHMVSERTSMRDLLDWARAFHPGISDDLAVAGLAKVSVNFGGWPPQVLNASFDLPRGSMIGTGMPSVRLAPVAIRYDLRQGITLAPSTLTIGRPVNSFRIDGTAKPGSGTFSLRARGSVADVRGIIAAAEKLGWNVARGWKITGPARCDLRWERPHSGAQTSLLGSVQWGTAAEGASIGASFLNRSVEGIRASAELQSGLTRVNVTSARAFGTRWSGTLEHELSDGWTFSLSGNSLSAADLDRWLDPRWRESFLDRMLPFLNSTATANATVDAVYASGNISLGEFALARAAIHQMRGHLTINDRRIEMANASGQLDGGKVSGSLQANFDRTPRYEIAADFLGVDLKALSGQFPSLAGEFSGTASARIRFAARGASRADLLSSLECRGTAVAKQLSVADIGLGTSSSAAAVDSLTDDPTLFSDATASFSCANGKIEFENLALAGPDASWMGGGSVDFARNLDLHLDRTSAIPGKSQTGKVIRKETDLRTGLQRPEYRITGNLGKPRVVKLPAAIAASDSRP